MGWNITHVISRRNTRVAGLLCRVSTGHVMDSGKQTCIHTYTQREYWCCSKEKQEFKKHIIVFSFKVSGDWTKDKHKNESLMKAGIPKKKKCLQAKLILFIFLFKKIGSKAGRVYENCLALLSSKSCLKINSYPLCVKSRAYNWKLFTQKDLTGSNVMQGQTHVLGIWQVNPSDLGNRTHKKLNEIHSKQMDRNCKYPREQRNNTNGTRDDQNVRRQKKI